MHCLAICVYSGVIQLTVSCLRRLSRQVAGAGAGAVSSALVLLGAGRAHGGDRVLVLSAGCAHGGHRVAVLVL